MISILFVIFKPYIQSISRIDSFRAAENKHDDGGELTKSEKHLRFHNPVDAFRRKAVYRYEQSIGKRNKPPIYFNRMTMKKNYKSLFKMLTKVRNESIALLLVHCVQMRLYGLIRSY